MTAPEKTRLHIALLQVLRELYDLGMPETGLVSSARLAGFDVALPALQVELRALADQNLIAAYAPFGGKRYRITELGMSKLAEAGI